MGRAVGRQEGRQVGDIVRAHGDDRGDRDAQQPERERVAAGDVGEAGE